MMRRRRKASQSDDENEEQHSNSSPEPSDSEGDDVEDQSEEESDNEKPVTILQNSTTKTEENSSNVDPTKKENNPPGQSTQRSDRGGRRRNNNERTLWDGKDGSQPATDRPASTRTRSRRGRGKPQGQPNSAFPAQPKPSGQPGDLPADPNAKVPKRKPKQYRKKGEENFPAQESESTAKVVRYSSSRERRDNRPQQPYTGVEAEAYQGQGEHYQGFQGKRGGTHKQYIPKSQLAAQQQMTEKMGKLTVDSKAFVPRGEPGSVPEGGYVPYGGYYGYGGAPMSHNSIQFYPLPEGYAPAAKPAEEAEKKPRSHAIQIMEPPPEK